MDKRLIYILFSLLPFSIISQETFEKGKVLRASATFGMGIMSESGLTNLLVPTSLEYYLDEKISVRSDAVIYLNHADETYMGFLQNHSLLVGASYHFTEKKQFDPYIGLQPGMAFSQYGIIDESRSIEFDPFSNEHAWLMENKKSSLTMNALISPHVGFNYYANNYFHLFLAARYIYGNHHSEIPVKSLQEIRFEFGLGFNLPLKKNPKMKE